LRDKEGGGEKGRDVQKNSEFDTRNSKDWWQGGEKKKKKIGSLLIQRCGQALLTKLGSRDLTHQKAGAEKGRRYGASFSALASEKAYP